MTRDPVAARERRRSYDREILRLGLPTLASLIAEPLYILVDTAVVGHLGTPELGGLAVAGALLVAGYSLFIFLAYGTTSSVARLVGAGETRQAVREGAQGLWLSALIGVSIAAVGLVLAEILVGAMGAEGEVRQHALVYLRISLIGVPALLITLAGTGYLRGMQNTRTPLVVTIAASLANLILELVLIYGFGFGIGASAAATVVVQIAAAVAYGAILRRDARNAEVALRPDPRMLRALGAVGFNLFVRTASLRAALLGATAVATRIGTSELAAHQIAFEIWNLLALCLDAIAIAGQAMIGRLLGAGAATEARHAARRMIGWGIAGGAVLGVVLVVVRNLLPPVFTGDAEVARLTAFLLVLVAVQQPLAGLAFVLDGILIGADDTRFLAWAMALAAFVLLGGLALVLELNAGIGALWTAVAAFMLTRAIALSLRFRSPAWQRVGSR
ncbi:MAG: MATE family efflux transporter [Actinomycetota bacterium]